MGPPSGPVKIEREHASAAANTSGAPTACADAQGDGSADEQCVIGFCASESCLVLVAGEEAPPVCHEASREGDAILLVTEANKSKSTRGGDDSSTMPIECFVSSAPAGPFRPDSVLKSEASSPAFTPLEEGPAVLC